MELAMFGVAAVVYVAFLDETTGGKPRLWYVTYFSDGSTHFRAFQNFWASPKSSVSMFFLSVINHPAIGDPP